MSKFKKMLNKFFVAAICASLVMGVVPVGATAATASTISINSTVATGSIATYNTSVTLSGVIDPAHQATVTIQSKRAGNTSYRTLGTTTSDASGNYSYTFYATARGSYRATWAGDSDHSTSTSSAITINVQATVTLGKTPRPSWAGQEFYVNGRITPRHRNASVSVQENKNGGWTTIARGRTNHNSNYSIKTSIANTGRHRLRVAFSDTDHSLNSSTGFNVSLKWANPWRISAAYDNYLVVSKRTFKLWYLRNGRIVKTFRAGVGQRKYPTPSGNFKIVRKAVRPTWHRPNSAWAKDMPESIPWPSSPLGARGLYTSASGIIVHGTLQPALLDRPYRAVSHGCVRLKNEWVSWLYNRIPVGTPIKIY